MAASAVARDRTKTEHIASVRGVKFSSPEGTACILELTDGYTAHGACDASEFTVGTQYRFYGKWKNHPRWGDQFHFTSHAVNGFGGRTGVVAYLCKYCEGVGERTAGRLWDKFGPDAVRVLREDPQRVVDEKLMTEEAAKNASQNLEAEQYLETTRIDLFEMFKGRGFHGRMIQQCIAKWGVRAPLMVRRDPFKLLGLSGAGFKRCDGLWRALELPLHRLKRQMYAASQLIAGERDGHTWVSGERAADFVVEAIGAQLADPFRALRLGIRSGRLSARKDTQGDVWVAVKERAEAERRIADGIKRLCGNK